MSREGLPTGQMQEETQELLDEYNELYNWEYNDMVDFIKSYGEEMPAISASNENAWSKNRRVEIK